MRRLIFILSLIGTGLCAYAQNSLKTYPAPEGVEMKDDFTVKVRVPGGEWQDVPTYMVKVDEVRDTKHCVEKSSLSYFDFEGKVEVSVASNGPKVESARIRPLSYGIEPVVQGNTVTFTLDRPRNLSVEVNGDLFHNLQLFANPLDRNNPIDGVNVRSEKQLAKKRPDVIYFGPGVHDLGKDTVFVKSGQTVYIAGGAVVYGTVHAVRVEDVKIYGRGIIMQKGRGEGVFVNRSKNVKIDGIISTQCPVGGSDGVEITNVKVISSYGWGDGFNVFASSNVRYDGCFARTSDDCTTVYATRKGFVGSASNILMENSVLWADVAHPIMIGIHGNVENPDTIENLTYRNIDILDHKEKQIDYQGCIALNCGDENLIRNALFENIRIEDFRQGQLFNIRIFYNKKYCLAPGRGIEDITFRNVSYNGSGEELSIIAGYNEDRKVKNIRFENLTINGKVISDDMSGKPAWYKTGDMGRIFVGEHVENIEFVRPAPVAGFDFYTGSEGERAYIRLPRIHKEVRAVLYCHQNMTEEVLFRSSSFCRQMDSLGVAMAFVQRGSQDWDVTKGCQERFEQIMHDFARGTGHPEIASAPVIPFGHSAQATFPWNFAAWNPDRTLCVISYHGDAPRTNLCGYGRANIEWGRTRNIDRIPGLMVMGEYEWWEARLLPAQAFRMMYPDSRISFLCDAGKGHFDLCPETQDYMARFIAKALENPRPEDGCSYSRWFEDGTESNDPHECFWYQDEEMVRLTKARYDQVRGKKMQYVSAKMDGELLHYDSDSHIKINASCGGEFTIEPVFVDESRNVFSGDHAPVRPRVVLVSGPAVQTGEYTFRYDPDYFGKDPKRLWSGITLCVEADGDDVYKPAVQEINLQVRL